MPENAGCGAGFQSDNQYRSPHGDSRLTRVDQDPNEEYVRPRCELHDGLQQRIRQELPIRCKRRRGQSRSQTCKKAPGARRAGEYLSLYPQARREHASKRQPHYAPFRFKPAGQVHSKGLATRPARQQGAIEHDNYHSDSLIEISTKFTATWNTGAQYDDTGVASWSSNNTGVATVQTGLTKGVKVGTPAITAIYAQPVQANVCSQGTPQCPTDPTSGSSNGCVTMFSQDGSNSSIFVGSDSNLLEGNLFFFNVNPPGGTFSGTSSNSSDTITPSSPVQGQEKAQVQTSTQSTSVGDRILTFTYSAPNCSASAPIAQSVTARKFAYLTNDSPPNLCGEAFGSDRTYTYTVFTHPDKTAVDSSNNLQGTLTSENTPGLTCGQVTGSGSLNANGQFTDHVSSLCSNQALTCADKTTQSLSVAGESVRSNGLQWTSSGVTYTNEGPTQ